jgi:rhamnulokinase
MSRYLAFDLGAESGRAMMGTIDGGRLALKELHRFANTPVRLPSGLYWDTLRLWHEIQQGLAAAARAGPPLDGVGVDTWGVDFGLLDAGGTLLENPRHYRDSRNSGMLERTFAVVPREEIFAETGLQFMQLNSLYQWYAARLASPRLLECAATLLFMPDLFSYFLTGVKRAELTIASTSQFYNPVKRRWAAELLARLGLDASILPEIVPAGTRLGGLLPHVAEASGLNAGTPVYATASHDTASAVAAVPAEGDSWCYISSGTWSLMGVEAAEPAIGERSLALNFTNEAGVEGRIRLLKNIAGMWLIQECRRAWAAAGRDYSYEELAALAAEARPFAAVIDPDAFLEPGRMPEKIAAFCEARHQAAPADPGATCRAILESLALRYRQVLESLEELTGRRIGTIHIVGGGSRNELLNQLAADATGRPVIAGPAEATAAGNVLTQAIGAGRLSGLAEARALVRVSFPVKRFEPRSAAGWEDAYTRFRALR